MSDSQQRSLVQRTLFGTVAEDSKPQTPRGGAKKKQFKRAIDAVCTSTENLDPALKQSGSESPAAKSKPDSWMSKVCSAPQPSKTPSEVPSPEISDKAPTQKSPLVVPDSTTDATTVVIEPPRLEHWKIECPDGGSGSLTSDQFNPSLLETKAWLWPQKPESRQFLFEVVANTWQEIENLKNSGSGSKKKATLFLANMFRAVLFHTPEQLLYALYLTLHKVAPDYFGLEIGLGESLLIRTMCETYGRREAQVKKDLHECGDLGLIAQQSKLSMSTLVAIPRLNLKTVFLDIREISQVKGDNAQTRKREKVRKLLAAAVGNEPKYLMRFLDKQLRIGVQAPTIISALAFACVMTPAVKPEAELPPLVSVVEDELLNQNVVNSASYTELLQSVKRVADCRYSNSSSCGLASRSMADIEARAGALEMAIREGYSQVPNLGYVMLKTVLGASADELRESCKIIPGVPVVPMLAKPTKAYGDVIDAMEGVSFRAEYKYDGERIQIHKLVDGSVRLFSRNLECLDSKYPDVQQAVNEAIKPEVKDIIIDAEVVAYNLATGGIQSFQTLSGRKRKDVDANTVEIQVCIFAFDCLRCNEVSLVEKSLEERREELNRSITEIPGKVMLAIGREITEIQELEDLMAEAIEANTEGLMVKTLTGERSRYTPSRRTVNWLKLKKDYLDGLGDSVDLVPIGAYHGRGKRQGAFGGYLLAVYDPEDEMFRTVCKVATGFSDKDLKDLDEAFEELSLDHKPPNYHVTEKLYPHVWLKAEQVWEIKAADLSISPVHTAGFDARGSDKGIGLRFPRYIRTRPDKPTTAATSSKQILGMYDNQFKSSGGPSKSSVADDDDDFFLI